MKNINKKSNRAFTLIELLLYGFLVSIFFVILVTFALEVTFGHARIIAKEKMSFASALIEERISQEVMQANYVDSTDSVFSVNPGKLVLVFPDASKSTFLLDANNRLKWQKTGEPDQYLMAQELEVKNFIVKNSAQAGRPASIQVQAVLKHKNPSDIPEYNLEFPLQFAVTTRK